MVLLSSLRRRPQRTTRPPPKPKRTNVSRETSGRCREEPQVSGLCEGAVRGMAGLGFRGGGVGGIWCGMRQAGGVVAARDGGMGPCVERRAGGVAGQRECGAEVGARRRGGGGGGRGGLWWNAAERDGTRRRGAGVARRMRRLGATHGVGVEGGNRWDVDGMRRARQRVRVGSGALGRRSHAPGRGSEAWRGGWGGRPGARATG